jgi:choline dehydrogenase-like flavoprotein
VLHDMPRHDNRVELDDEVEDAWGLPVPRITLDAARERPRDGRFLIDRNAEILEAAGARGAARSTSTASRQLLAPARDDADGRRPTTLGLTAWCRAHEVDNLYVVDGGSFPTGTGATDPTIMANAWRVAERVLEARGRPAS